MPQRISYVRIGIWSPASCFAILQDLCDRLLESPGIRRHVPIQCRLPGCCQSRCVRSHISEVMFLLIVRLCKSLSASLHLWSNLLLPSIQCCEIRGCPQVRTRVWRGTGDANHVGSCHACTGFQRSVNYSLDSNLSFLRCINRYPDGILSRQLLRQVDGSSGYACCSSRPVLCD